jgi:hypothetical protein
MLKSLSDLGLMVPKRTLRGLQWSLETMKTAAEEVEVEVRSRSKGKASTTQMRSEQDEHNLSLDTSLYIIATHLRLG